jgi:cell division protein FtsB
MAKQTTSPKDEKRQRYINIFWVALTVVIAICTIVVSISSIGDMLRTRHDRRIVEAKIENLETKIATDSIFIHKITTSPEFMERFARETYHMQRKGETVYIME